MILGVTGTQDGLTRSQAAQALHWLQRLAPGELHHGDCIGVDAEIDALAEQLGIARVVHPPLNPTKRAHCKAQSILLPKGYLDRNHDIVDACDLLLGFPKGMGEELRSGTWATIRYAKKMRRRTVIVYPDGSEERRFIPNEARL